VPTCFQWDSLNDSGYCNKKYDDLYQQQGVTTDQQKRQEIVYQMQHMIYDSRSYIVLAYLDTIEAWSSSWDGFVESPQGFLNEFSKETLIEVHQV
jgi:peptide/nickel transport system substrate-binding protein